MKPKTISVDEFFGSASLLVGLLANQLTAWRRTVSWPLRFLGFWFFTLLATSIGLLFSRLPAGGVEALLRQAFEPLAALLLLLLAAFSIAFAIATLLAFKLQESL